MTKSRVAPPRVRLVRVALDVQTHALLASESRLANLPIQDLIGGACEIALLVDQPGRSRWYANARALRRLRHASQT